MVAKTTGLSLMDKNLPMISLVKNSLYSYLQEINKIPSLTGEEEFLLAHSYLENNDIVAAQRLVASHLKLVAKIAIKYRNYGLPLIELISEGNLGLIHAVKKYKPDLGFRLSTYAMWWIKASIQEFILKSWSLVKIGTTAAQKKIFFSLSKIKRRLSNLYARSIEDKDYQLIADEIGVTKREVLEVDQRISGSDISLNQPALGREENEELINFISETKPNQECILATKQESLLKQNLLSEALQKVLNERELYIFQSRKLKTNPKTLEELSKQFVVSKERIRQIEGIAFTKIQNYILNKYKAMNTYLV